MKLEIERRINRERERDTARGREENIIIKKRKRER